MKQSTIQNHTEVALAENQDSQPLKIDRKTKVYHVLVAHGDWEDGARLRVVNVAATGIREAREVARRVLAILDLDSFPAVTADALETGYIADDLTLMDVYQSREKAPGHVWTKSEVEADNAAEVLAKAAAELLEE